MKNYDNFIINEGVFNNINRSLILLSGFIIFSSKLIFEMILFKFFKKNSKKYLFFIEKSMDILYTYTINIDKIDISNLSKKDIKKYKKIYKKVKKLFINDNTIKEQIKSYFINKFHLNQELIDIINNYNIRIYHLTDKYFINLLLNYNNIIYEIDPFNEDVWDNNIEEDFSKYINKYYYIANLNDNNSKIAYSKLEYAYENQDNEIMFRLNSSNRIFNINKNDFLFFLNKYISAFTIKNKEFKDYNLFEDHSLIIVDSNKKYLFENMIKYNYDYIKIILNIENIDISAEKLLKIMEEKKLFLDKNNIRYIINNLNYYHARNI